MKRRAFIRAVSSVLVYALLFTLASAAALSVSAISGSGTKSDPYVVETYSQLMDYMTFAPTDGSVCYIKLGSDLVSNDSNNDHSLTLVSEYQNVVIDLAGKTITRESNLTVDPSVIRAKEGRLTINDSVGTGGVHAKGKLYSAIALSAQDPIYVDNGEIIINGGSYTSEALYGSAVYNEASYLCINGGKFSAYRALFLQAGKSEIYGGEYFSTSSNGTESVYAVSDQDVTFYSLVCHGAITCGADNKNLWSYIPYGDVFVDGVEQSKASTHRFDGETIVIETDFVKSIELTLDAPVEGKVPDMIPLVPSGVDYCVCPDLGSIGWFEGSRMLGEDEVFKKDVSYSVRVYVVVDSVVSPSIVAYVNGNEAKLEYARSEGESRYYWVEYGFLSTIPATVSMKTVGISGLELPVAGKTPDYSIKMGSDLYQPKPDFGTNNSGIEWYTSAGDLLEPTDKFVEGEYYMIRIRIETKEIEGNPLCSFYNGTELQLNGITVKETAGGNLINRNPKRVELFYYFESPASAKPNATLGDVNSDGSINQYDYILVKRHYFGTRYLTDDELTPADVNKDGTVNQFDYILICRHYFGTFEIV